nr:hypothetical protein [Tanacetum cinerariifolium]
MPSIVLENCGIAKLAIQGAIQAYNLDCREEAQDEKRDYIEHDSDSHMEEIDLSFNPDDPMLPSIKENDDDSKRDILILEELLDNYSLSFPVNESFYFDIPLFSRPLAKPPDGNT